LLDPPPGLNRTSRLTELHPSRTSPSLDPPRELVQSTRTGRLFLDLLLELPTEWQSLFLDPPLELDPSTKTENDLSLGSATPLVPVLALVVELLLSARLSLTIDNGRSSNTTDSEVFLSTMSRMPTGLCPPTGLNRLSVTDPSLTS